MGVNDKKYLTQTMLLCQGIGKASVTGYCIKFKTLTDIKIDVLKAAMHRMELNRQAFNIDFNLSK